MVKSWRLLKLPGIVLAVGIMGCSEGSKDLAPSLPMYEPDVAPIIQRACTGCHLEGGIGPFPLTTYEEVAGMSGSIRTAVEDRIMPPWPPDNACIRFKNDRSLTEAERTLLLAWLDADTPEGEPVEQPTAHPTPQGGLPRVDVTLRMEEPFTPPDKGSADVFRCFIFRWPLDHPMYITGVQPIPGNRALVHHMDYFLLPEDIAAQARAADEASPGPGYPPEAGPETLTLGLGTFRVLGTYAPSTGDALIFPRGTGMLVEPGASILLQVHYALLNVETTPDDSHLLFMVEDTVEREGFFVPFYDPAWYESLFLPAGDPDVQLSYTGDPFPIFEASTGYRLPPGPLLIYASFHHMHYLGRQGEDAVIRPDGSRKCLLTIPNWDFHWQDFYWLQNPVPLAPGDLLYAKCAWDNSAGNQPEVDGIPQVPRDVRLGAWSTDEMCLAGYYVAAME